MAQYLLYKLVHLLPKHPILFFRHRKALHAPESFLYWRTRSLFHLFEGNRFSVLACANPMLLLG